MNRKAKGTRREHQTIRFFEERGYACTRAAASLGRWDIVAVGPKDILLIQVKANRGPSGGELLALEMFKTPCDHVLKVLVVWKNGHTEPIVTYL